MQRDAEAAPADLPPSVSTHGRPTPAEVLRSLHGVRARLRGHGGDVDIVAVDDDGAVEVQFLGACRACPALAFTYAAVVEPHLMSIEGVESIRAAVRVSPAVRVRLRRLLGSGAL